MTTNNDFDSGTVVVTRHFERIINQSISFHNQILLVMYVISIYTIKLYVEELYYKKDGNEGMQCLYIKNKLMYAIILLLFAFLDFRKDEFTIEKGLLRQLRLSFQYLRRCARAT